MKKGMESGELRSEYKREDFGQGVRGKYFAQKAAGLTSRSTGRPKKLHAG